MIYCPTAKYPNDKYDSDKNHITSAFELYTFKNTDHKLGDKYVFYIDDSCYQKFLVDPRTLNSYHGRVLATNWMGEILGTINIVKHFNHNFGAKMRSIYITDINGNLWYGRYSYKNQQCVVAKRIKN